MVLFQSTRFTCTCRCDNIAYGLKIRKMSKG